MTKKQLVFQAVSALLSALSALGMQSFQYMTFQHQPPSTTINAFGPVLVFENHGDVTIEGSAIGQEAPASAVRTTSTTAIAPRIIPVTGHDRRQRWAEFEIAIISQEYSWKLNSTTVVEFGGKPFNFVEYLETDGLQKRLEAAEDIIALGAASCEGSFRSELKRAEERAMTLVAWLRQVSYSSEPQDLYTLNLGRHHKECAGESQGEDMATGGSDTKHQRLITIIWVPRKEDGVNMKEALYDAMGRAGENERLRLHPADYSVFRLKRAT